MFSNRFSVLRPAIRSFRNSGKSPHPPRLSETVPNRSIIFRATAFTTITITSVYTGSIIIGYETYRSNLTSLKEKAQRSKNMILERIKPFIGPFDVKRLRDSDKIYLGILGANFFIYLLHFSGARFARHFYCSITSPSPALSQLTSIFSHTFLFHLVLNMYVLHSFIDPLVRTLGREQFLALYVSGGVFASWMSLVRKAVQRSPVPSLGASGSICAVISFYCMLYPQGQLCVPLVENIYPHSFSAESALKVILAIEAMGFLFFQRYSVIDHSAHFGGLLFGLTYHKFGYENVQEFKREILRSWILFKKNTGLGK